MRQVFPQDDCVTSEILQVWLSVERIFLFKQDTLQKLRRQQRLPSGQGLSVPATRHAEVGPVHGNKPRSNERVMLSVKRSFVFLLLGVVHFPKMLFKDLFTHFCNLVASVFDVLTASRHRDGFSCFPNKHLSDSGHR